MIRSYSAFGERRTGQRLANQPYSRSALLRCGHMANPPQKSWIESASLGLGILSFINLFNYLDRYVVSALVESLKHSELALSDAKLGSLMSGFLIVFTLGAPLFGALGDRGSRPRLIAFAVACWSA